LLALSLFTTSTLASTHQIHYKDTTQCLTVTNSAYGDGTTIDLQTCLDASNPNYGLQNWDITRGSGAVKLVGTNFCLDAGSSPANGVVAKIWTCYPGVYQQTWYYTDDNRIAINGGNQCLDFASGSSNVVQTWQCSDGDVQQIWTTKGPTTTTTTTATTSTTSSTTTTTAPPQPTCYSCPATDDAGFSVGPTNTSTDSTITCPYPAVPGEDPNDFYCQYSAATGALTVDNDAGLCPSTAVVGSCAQKRHIKLWGARLPHVIHREITDEARLLKREFLEKRRAAA